jgi:hypothetical protein
MLDILPVIEEIEAKGAQLVSIGKRFDTTSPMGVTMFQVAGVFAQLERAMIRARQREGIRKEGWKVSGRQAALRPGNDPSNVGDRHEAPSDQGRTRPQLRHDYPSDKGCLENSRTGSERRSALIQLGRER